MGEEEEFLKRKSEFMAYEERERESRRTLVGHGPSFF
jgi:hypothetical protein